MPDCPVCPDCAGEASIGKCCCGLYGCKCESLWPDFFCPCYTDAEDWNEHEEG